MLSQTSYNNEGKVCGPWTANLPGHCPTYNEEKYRVSLIGQNISVRTSTFSPFCFRVPRVTKRRWISGLPYTIMVFSMNLGSEKIARVCALYYTWNSEKTEAGWSPGGFDANLSSINSSPLRSKSVLKIPLLFSPLILWKVDDGDGSLHSLKLLLLSISLTGLGWNIFGRTEG